MTDRTLHEKLSDPGISFLQKLRLASLHGLDYWWSRGNPPNETPDVYREVLKRLKEPLNVDWVDRLSQAGANALLGEQQCFQFEAEIELLGKKKKFYFKGYFYNQNDLKGVTIQSFRDVTPKIQIVKK